MRLVKVAVSQLTGIALDYGVEMAVFGVQPSAKHVFAWRYQNDERRRYSTDRDHGGMLLHEFAVTLKPSDPYAKFGGTWSATCLTPRESAAHSYYHEEGDTPLLAGLRCIVGAQLGDTIEIPSELLEQSQ